MMPGISTENVSKEDVLSKIETEWKLILKCQRQLKFHRHNEGRVVGELDTDTIY